jgi:hypothetical protein
MQMRALQILKQTQTILSFKYYHTTESLNPKAYNNKVECKYKVGIVLSKWTPPVVIKLPLKIIASKEIPSLIIIML